MRNLPAPSVSADPRSSSCSQSVSKARTFTPAMGEPASLSTTMPQTTQAPNRWRIEHQYRHGMQYSKAAMRPASVLRHAGWSVVIENCSGWGAFGVGLRWGTVPQIDVDLESLATVLLLVAELEAKGAVIARRGFGQQRGSLLLDVVVGQDGERVLGRRCCQHRDAFFGTAPVEAYLDLRKWFGTFRADVTTEYTFEDVSHRYVPSWPAACELRPSCEWHPSADTFRGTATLEEQPIG